MARVKYLDGSDLDPSDQSLLARPINLFRALANHPAALRQVHGVGEWVRWSGSLDTRLRELVILQVGLLADSAYEYSHHVKLALDFGAQPEDISGLPRFNAGAEVLQYGPIDRAALAAAREIAEGGVSDPTWSDLVTVLGESDAIEVVLVASYYAMVVRILSSLAVDLEPEYQRYLDEYPMR